MPSKLIILATVSGLALTSAWAQTQTPAPTAPKAEPGAAMTPPASSKPIFVNRQNADQWVMSKFKGTDVVGPGNEQIGDVNDILFDKTGTVAAFVIGVGGFLGIGSKDVAVAPASFQVIKDDNGADKLQIAMTKDELKQAPAFEYYSPPQRGVSTAPTQQRPRPAPATQ